MWLSVDAMADQRPSMTPYNFVSNNPIMRIDPDGNLDWDIDNDDDTKNDVLTLAGADKQYVKFNDNLDGTLGVYLDFGDLSCEEINEIFENNEDLRLIDDLVYSDKSHYYETAEMTMRKEYTKTGFVQFEQNIGYSKSGVINLAWPGLDSRNQSPSMKADYDSEVYISTNGRWVDRFNLDIPRNKIMFHELEEGRLRALGIDYSGGDPKGAHLLSVERSNKSNQSKFSGDAHGYIKPIR